MIVYGGRTNHEVTACCDAHGSSYCWCFVLWTEWTIWVCGCWNQQQLYLQMKRVVSTATEVVRQQCSMYIELIQNHAAGMTYNLTCSLYVLFEREAREYLFLIHFLRGLTRVTYSTCCLTTVVFLTRKKSTRMLQKYSVRISLFIHFLRDSLVSLANPLFSPLSYSSLARKVLECYRNTQREYLFSHSLQRTHSKAFQLIILTIVSSHSRKVINVTEML